LTTFDAVIAGLGSALGTKLPGLEAQRAMAPRPRGEWPGNFSPERIRRAAGLLLLFPIEGQVHIALTLRAAGLRHGGQISLPGGVIEPGETIEQAALREAHEEVALSTEHVRIIGALTPLDIPVSGFRLHPVVAAVPHRPKLAAADGEVERILEVAIDELLDPAHLISTTRVRDGRIIIVPAFSIAGHEIWGATAMVLAEFLALLGWRRRMAVDET
jgi:8-oxo-dGTP pyrophosphatase MutT (NUDIX family)